MAYADSPSSGKIISAACSASPSRASRNDLGEIGRHIGNPHARHAGGDAGEVVGVERIELGGHRRHFRTAIPGNREKRRGRSSSATPAQGRVAAVVEACHQMPNKRAHAREGQACAGLPVASAMGPAARSNRRRAAESPPRWSFRRQGRQSARTPPHRECPSPRSSPRSRAGTDAGIVCFGCGSSRQSPSRECRRRRLGS